LPFVENKNCLSTYEVIRDFSELSDAVDNCTDSGLKNDISKWINNTKISNPSYRLSEVKEGVTAPSFGEDGGADQIELSLPIKYLIKLGFIKKLS
jgi:hypothetical protein